MSAFTCHLDFFRGGFIGDFEMKNVGIESQKLGIALEKLGIDTVLSFYRGVFERANELRLDYLSFMNIAGEER